MATITKQMKSAALSVILFLLPAVSAHEWFSFPFACGATTDDSIKSSAAAVLRGRPLTLITSGNIKLFPKEDTESGEQRTLVLYEFHHHIDGKHFRWAATFVQGLYYNVDHLPRALQFPRPGDKASSGAAGEEDLDETIEWKSLYLDEDGWQSISTAFRNAVQPGNASSSSASPKTPKDDTRRRTKATRTFESLGNVGPRQAKRRVASAAKLLGGSENCSNLQEALQAAAKCSPAVKESLDSVLNARLASGEFNVQAANLTDAQVSDEFTQRNLGYVSAENVLRAQFAANISTNQAYKFTKSLAKTNPFISPTNRAACLDMLKTLGSEELIGKITLMEPSEDIECGIRWPIEEAISMTLQNKNLYPTFQKLGGDGFEAYLHDINDGSPHWEARMRTFQLNKQRINERLPVLVYAHHVDGAECGTGNLELATLQSANQVCFTNSPIMSLPIAAAYCKEKKNTLQQIVSVYSNEMLSLEKNGLWYEEPVAPFHKFWVPLVFLNVSDLSANWKLSSCKDKSCLWCPQTKDPTCLSGKCDFCKADVNGPKLENGRFPNAILELPAAEWYMDTDPHWLLNSSSILFSMLGSRVHHLCANASVGNRLIGFQKLGLGLQAIGLNTLWKKLMQKISVTLSCVPADLSVAQIVALGSASDQRIATLDSDAQGKMNSHLVATLGSNPSNIKTFFNPQGNQTKKLLYGFDILMYHLNDADAATIEFEDAKLTLKETDARLTKLETDKGVLEERAGAAGMSLSQYVHAESHNGDELAESFMEAQSELAGIAREQSAAQNVKNSIYREHFRVARGQEGEAWLCLDVVNCLRVWECFVDVWEEVNAFEFEDVRDCAKVTQYVRKLADTARGIIPSSEFSRNYMHCARHHVQEMQTRLWKYFNLTLRSIATNVSEHANKHVKTALLTRGHFNRTNGLYQTVRNMRIHQLIFSDLLVQQARVCKDVCRACGEVGHRKNNARKCIKHCDHFLNIRQKNKMSIGANTGAEI